MPLHRLNDNAFDSQLEGVYFGMKDGSKTIRCLASHEALSDKIRGSGDRAECLETFHIYRHVIEAIASTKQDAGQVRADGVVLVTSRDLNPDQFIGVPPRN